MGTYDPQSDAAGGGAAWRNRRKRIVAREVSASAAEEAAREIEREMRLAGEGAVEPEELNGGFNARAEESLIVDPTQLVGERHRRHGAQLKYRVTQASTGVSIFTAAVAIALVFDDEDGVAMGLAGAAVGLALVAIYLVRTSRLAYRLRGYAAAAGVLAVLALVLSLVPNPFH